ncbi:2-methylpropanoate--CoA ligase ccl4 [Trifolium repens]|nr:2-methylpropanoate--CoA ligase ccl4 [Trifolium repens]
MEHLTRNQANSTPLTPLTFLERASTVYGDSISIIYNNTSFTWSQTHRRCLQLASSLSSIGIKKGHVVSVLSPNTPAMYELHFAVPMSGAILNNLNFRLDHKSLSVLLTHSESKLIFVDIQSLSLTLNALSLFPKTTQIPKLVLINDDTLATHQIPSPPKNVNIINTYEGLIAKGDPNFKWIRPESEWDPITLNYTSGTTSSPKGVVHCHRATFIVSLDSLIDWSVPVQPVYLWTLPMFHSNGWSYPWGIAAVGGTNICARRIDAPTIYRLIESHGVTHMCAAPVVLNMLSCFNKTEPLKKPVHVLTGGSSPPATILCRAEWTKDVIISGGENMSSVEVEAVLYMHPAVKEAAVVGRPDEFWGETPCAFVSLKDELKENEIPTEKEVNEFCRERLPHFMVPKTVVFKEELPKTSTGKVQKHVLRRVARAMGSLPIPPPLLLPSRI